MSASAKEIQNILSFLQDENRDEAPLALATVVDLQGSGYRRTGARMLIQQNGQWIGAISGGCLEGNALRQARRIMLSGIPELVTYNTLTDESARQTGASLGCNGILRVWIEPITPQVVEYLEELQKAFEGVEEQWFVRKIGKDYGPLRKWNSPEIQAFDLNQQEGLQLEESGKSGEGFAVEKVIPAIRLLIFGGGQDARPLCKLAHEMGWKTTVTDDCAAKALPVRFPEADRVIHLDRETAISQLSPDAFSAAVLISHNFDYDKAILRNLIPLNLSYVGVLGPKNRFQRLCDELELEKSQIDQLFAPVGLDIGAQTPFEIALAVIAEIQAVFSGRAGNSLRQRQASIHARQEIRS
ncbi:MAG: XdhC family protein [Bacteroidia bacterium]|nr:XdhC family protein [Bacteroidia bacterium]